MIRVPFVAAGVPNRPTLPNGAWWHRNVNSPNGRPNMLRRTWRWQFGWLCGDCGRRREPWTTDRFLVARSYRGHRGQCRRV